MPGDYSFPVDNALEKVMTWVGCANELNAGYAADGYARARGAALLCTTYGVGELSALNAMMGSLAERVPVFHLVGVPSHRLQRSHQPLHHSLGDGDLHRFFEISAAAACVSALLTPENVVVELERLIHTALLEQRPAYLVVPGDYALMEVMEVMEDGLNISQKTFLPVSDQRELAAATEQILQRLAAAKNPIILPSFSLARYELEKEFETLLDISGVPYATMLMDKAVISESHPNYLGMYRGSASEPFVKEAVESADLILNVGGALFTDLGTGFFSHEIKSEKMITMATDFVEMAMPHDDQPKNYSPVALQDLLAALNKAFQERLIGKKKKNISAVLPPKKILAKLEDPITTESFYARMPSFLQPQDHVVVESGFCMLEMASIKLPAGARYYHQSLWGSIGWATPATLGVAISKPEGRVVLVTGDGSHQFTANELGTMGRYGVNPIIFIMNDGVYAIEEFLDQNRGHLYNKLAPWSYAKLPQVMGCHDWLTMQIRTNAELDQALAKATQSESACYFEILLGSHLRPPAPEAMTKAFYQNFPN
ncbi:MAG: thiamine pyrophosphate-binding protein [Verrucomicrobiae bacterium]|nr:thiamine pyrophosphate-binding protein [Verrucomicrobiae bacterium]